MIELKPTQADWQRFAKDNPQGFYQIKSIILERLLQSAGEQLADLSANTYTASDPEPTEGNE